MALQIPTIQELKNLYLSLAQAEYSEADISEFSDYQAKASGAGGMGARLALDAYILFNAVYPQNGNEFGINTQLAAKGVPSQYPSSPSLLTCNVLDITASKTFNVPVGTQVTASNGQLYSVISRDGDSSIVQVSTAFPSLYLLSINNGANTSQSVGTTLSFTTPIYASDGSLSVITQLSVTTVVEGANEESLSSAINRLIEIDQIPLNGSRSTDIKYLVINQELGVNDAVVLVNNQLKYSTGNYNTGIFDVGGSPVTDEFLNKGLVVGTTAEVYNRSLPATVYNQSLQKVVAQDIIGLFPIANTVSTQAITTSTTTPYIQISVTLQAGRLLSDQVVSDNVSLSLEQIIQREVRRAICGQNFGAALQQNLTTGELLSSSIPTSAIEQQLDFSLGTPTTSGSLGSYLLSRSIQYYNGTTYVYQPQINLTLGIPTNPSNPLAWVYDISLDPAHIYSNIVVVAL